jgi:hypothetical protein
MMAKVARAMATARKRAMTTDSDNTDNGYGEEGGRHLMAATMEMAQRTLPLALQLERGG